MVNAPVCGTGIRGFKTHHPPHNAKVASDVSPMLFIVSFPATDITIGVVGPIGPCRSMFLFKTRKLCPPFKEVLLSPI